MRHLVTPLQLSPKPPPVLQQLALLLLLMLPALALAGHSHDLGVGGHGDYEEEEDLDHDHDQDSKEVGPFNGHSLLDLGSLGVLAALKIKFVVVLLVAAAVFFLLTKNYKTQCVFGNCRPSYSTYGYYPYVDYTYVGYELPAGSAAYRRPGVVPGAVSAAAGSSAGAPGLVGVGAKDSHHLSDLTARVWNSIDLASMAFSALNVQEDDCRRKLVCQADRAAARNPLLRAALSWFSSSLARYRTVRARLGSEFGSEPEVEWRQEDPCEDMYPQCLHHDLPSALGGPDRPHTYLVHDGHLEALHHGHHHLHHGHEVIAPDGVPPVESWQPMHAGYPQEYRYPYVLSAFKDPDPIREDGVVAHIPGGVFQADQPVAPTTSHPPSPTADVILAGVETSPVSTSVGAPAPEDAPAASLIVTTTPAPNSATSGTAPGPAEPRTRLDAVLDSAKQPTERHGAGSGGTHVWRRVLFGAANNRTKPHRD